MHFFELYIYIYIYIYMNLYSVRDVKIIIKIGKSQNFYFLDYEYC